MCFVLAFMFVALISDRVGADMVMMTSLTLCMASGIISVEEGLEGFSNEGLLTVLVLFVVAAGIGHTGALDWYMGRLLGRPKNTTDGQLRLMLPVAIVSAFLNNTPVVAVMIPIVQRWGQNVGISHQQLLVPLSFSSILGGTCTLIGTSTNLVVVGLLNDRYPDNTDINIGLFDLGKYGVPIALIGMSYILIASPFLLPGGSASSSSEGSETVNAMAQSDILLGARLTRWSTAAGRSVKRSGLRDTGGIFLVSVLRAATGNMHRAVGQDFVLNVGDILYFTGLVEEFGDFCHEHGLELITTEVDVATTTKNGRSSNGHHNAVDGLTNGDADAASPLNDESVALPTILQQSEELAPIGEDDEGENGEDDAWRLGETGQSLMQYEDEARLRSINKITDMIRGTYEPAMVDMHQLDSRRNKGRRRRKTVSSLFEEYDPTKIIIVKDSNIRYGDKPMVMIAVNCRDRPGLLLDISRGLLRLSLQLHHSEAAVIGFRSLSVWRCEALEDAVADIQEMWSVLNALLENETGVQAVKERGLRVIRAVVQKGSRLVGKTAVEVNFRETYKAAIVTSQRGGKSGESLTAFKFQAGDMLVLQASDDSPLLLTPPEDFYKNLDFSTRSKRKRSTSGSSLSEVLKSISNPDIAGLGKSNRGEKESSSVGSEEVRKKMDDANSQGSQISLVGSEDGGFGFFGDAENDSHTRNGTSADEEVGVDGISRMQTEEVWADLKVIQAGGSTKSSSREFLSAMEVSPRSALADKTAAQSGLDKLSGVFLVEIERPVPVRSLVTQTVLPASQAVAPHISATPEPISSQSISPDEQPLRSGDVLWYAGSAIAIGDLRKIPGLKPVEDEQVKKVEGDIHERRLVQAVIARQGPLVGKTVKDMRFRTRYGAAVIAVHREGKRVHDHPGQVKLHAGDVLLLEAGPSFFVKSANNDKSFALLSEIKDSAPPRLSLLIPALMLTAAALAVYTANVASLLICALIASILMVCLGILSQQEVRDAINWEVYITIAAAFGIGTALTNSGVASGVADFLVSVGDVIALGDAGLLGAVYFATFLISNVVTNNAAAALIFPIAIDSAEQTGIDVTLMSFSVMLGASASFMSPFGYTTNLLIYGPGSYTYSDFLRIGTPMQIVLWILSVALLSLDPSQWYIGWIGTSAVFLLVVTVRMSSGVLTSMCRSDDKSD